MSDYETTVDRKAILRAMDKRDRLGTDGVFELLTKGRKDKSGTFTPGCGLPPSQALYICRFLEIGSSSDLEKRLNLIFALDSYEVYFEYTAFEQLLDMLDKSHPRYWHNVACALDDIVAEIERRGGSLTRPTVMDYFREWKNAPKDNAE